MLQSTPTRNYSAAPVQTPSKSPHGRRLLIAMTILFVTLIAVLARDGQLWFAKGSEEARFSADDRWVGPSASSSSENQAAPATTQPKPAIKVEKAVAQPAIAAADRKPLQPINANVVGDGHHMPQVTPVAQTSSDTTIVAEYPMLARQMKVQGSVLMQALIAATGKIEELRVISGPAILSAAARQAVMQYHFKPYLQDGQPVETSARVTVNFAIRVLDDATAHLGSSASNGSY